MKKIILFIIAFIPIVKNNADAQYWSAVGEGIGYPSWKLAQYSDGTESGTDAPVTGASVASLCVYNGELYAAGCSFANGGRHNILKWDGSNWSQVGGDVYTEGGGGVDTWINVLLVYNGELYAGGRFTNAGNIPANNIAKWNGSEWSAVGEGLGEYGYEVSSLTIFNGALYAGGHFNTAGGVPVNNIAKWDGTLWTPVGNGIDVYMDHFPYGAVYSLAVHNGELYAGGYFDSIGVGKNNIVKWNGTNWSAVGTDIQDRVTCLASYHGELYAGGHFMNLKKWDGNKWSALSSAIGPVYRLYVNNDLLYAGGYFTTAGNVSARNIATWNGNEWSAIGKGLDAMASCMVVHNNALFAGGEFTTAGEVRVNRIAKWTTHCSSPPNSPGNIIGPSDLCLNGAAEFFVDPLTDAADFTWTFPAGWSGNSVSNSIKLSAGTTGSTISVTANNTCGSSSPKFITVKVVDSISAQLNPIAGAKLVCPNSVQTYSTNPIQTATHYEWIFPGEWKGTSTTNTITVNTSTLGGVISVKARNSCSISNTQTLFVDVDNTVIQLAPINGTDTVSMGQTEIYSVNPVNNATGYSWSLNGGGNIVSGQNTNSIIVRWLASGTHVLSVKVNRCGGSVEKTKSITVSNTTAIMNADNAFELTILPNPSQDKFSVKGNPIKDKQISIEVLNMTGQLVYHLMRIQVVGDLTPPINLGKLPQGNYLLRIVVKNKAFVKMISKMN